MLNLINYAVIQISYTNVTTVNLKTFKNNNNKPLIFSYTLGFVKKKKKKCMYV